MKKIRNTGTVTILNDQELALIKGGDDRDYVVVIIDGTPTKVYV